MSRRSENNRVLGVVGAAGQLAAVLRECVCGEREAACGCANACGCRSVAAVVGAIHVAADATAVVWVAAATDVAVVVAVLLNATARCEL